MTKPLLQLALDHTNAMDAINCAALLKNHVDIIEAGTILCISEGINVVKRLRNTCPKSVIVADLKVADAGETLAKQAFNAGANLMTVICSAPLATIEKAHQIAKQYAAEIQIELFGNWTLIDAKAWVDIGVTQAIYHRGRDAQANGQSWSTYDLNMMKALSDLGVELSVTGGIEAKDLRLFKSIPVKAFIAGRALYDVADPISSAKQFKDAIEQVWGNHL